MSLTRAAALLVLALPFTACSSATGPSEPAASHPDGVLAPRVEGFVGRPFGIRVSSQGLVLVTQQDANSVQAFSLSASAPLPPAVPVGADPGEVVFNRAGTTAYVSAYYGGGVHVINTATQKQTSSIPVSTNAYRLALSADESRLFVSSVDGRLYSVPLIGSGPMTSLVVGGALQGLTISKSGQTLFVSSTSGSVTRVNAATMTVIGSRSLGGSPQDVVLSLDERELYVANESGGVDVLDATSLADIVRINLPGFGAFGMAISPDGAELYVTSPLTGVVAIIDRQSRAIKKLLTVNGRPRRAAFSADGKTAVVANEGNWVDVVR